MSRRTKAKKDNREQEFKGYGFHIANVQEWYSWVAHTLMNPPAFDDLSQADKYRLNTEFQEYDAKYQ